MNSDILQKISNDLDFLKDRVMTIEKEINELKDYELRPEYELRLNNIEKQKKIPFKNIKDLRKIIEA